MGELRELAELREDAASFAQAEARARHRDESGLPPASTFPERVRAHRLACSRDGLSQAVEGLREAEASGPAKAGRVARLANLRDLLVRARAFENEPGAFQELREAELRPSVELHGDAGLHGLQPIRSIERELGRSRARAERADMEAAFARAISQSDGVRTAAWEAAASALGEMEAGEPIDAAAQMHERGWAPSAVASTKSARELDDEIRERVARGELGTDGRALPSTSTSTSTKTETASDVRPHSAIARSCERLLDKTDPIARDLGAWLLARETGAQPFPGDAERHDLLQLLRAPRCAPAFPRGEMLRTCRRWAEAWRLDLEADRAIRVDDEERPLAREGARAAPIDPPDEVRLHAFLEEGPWALEQLLSALGAAQLYAGPPGDAPPEDLLAHDPALPIASGAIFAGLIRDDEFRRRCAKAELPVDDARALAVGHLFELRIDAAATLASLEAHRTGLGARAAQAHRELFARAALATLPAGLALRELDPFLGPWARLRGESFAALLRHLLRERFDEDWWRNPRAQGPLRSMWTRGGRSTLRELWSELAPGDVPGIDALVADLTASVV